MRAVPRGRPSSLAFRLARLVFYAGCVTAVVARNAAAIRDGARALVSPGAYLPSVPCIPCALMLALAMFGYTAWLWGATFAGWAMPAWTHVVPLVALVATLAAGPLQPGPVPPDVDVTRAPELTLFAAMTDVGQSLEKGRLPCDDAAALTRVLADRARVGLPGYRRFGRLSGYHVRIVKPADGPSPDLLRGDVPPTVIVACSADRRRFWLSGVSLDVDTGTAQMLRDGVGRIAVVSGSASEGGSP